jgi:hypothetical protein
MSGRYEIQIRHRVGEEVIHLLADLRPQVVDDSTILYLAGTEQPALHGALTRVHSLGLEIISVERIETPG